LGFSVGWSDIGHPYIESKQINTLS